MSTPIKGTFEDMYGHQPNSIRPLRVDASTHALLVMDYEHHEIHDGSAFKVDFSNTTTSDDDHRSLIGFKTPTGTKWGHIVVTIYASHPAEFSIIEGPTIDLSEGTETAILNRNRNSDNDSTMLSLETVPAAAEATTMTEAQLAGAQFSGGTVIDYTILVGGEGPKAIGGESRGEHEWVLKADTIYVFLMQNIGANANTHHIDLDWYEHTDKD